jgi:hypothetical protein
MSATRLHKLATVYLVVLYGVVGLSGEQLHYLATGGLASRTDSPAGETVVYFHVHGPDYHGHFHRHKVHRHRPVSTAAPDRNVRSKSPCVTNSAEGIPHHPHACPLLSLVGKLKLGHSSAIVFAITADVLITAAWERETHHAIQAVAPGPARGPPSAPIA